MDAAAGVSGTFPSPLFHRFPSSGHPVEINKKVLSKQYSFKTKIFQAMFVFRRPATKTTVEN